MTGSKVTGRAQDTAAEPGEAGRTQPNSCSCWNRRPDLLDHVTSADYSYLNLVFVDKHQNAAPAFTVLVPIPKTLADYAHLHAAPACLKPENAAQSPMNSRVRTWWQTRA
jgi:hypothetical protein